MSEALFEGYEPAIPEPVEKMSADRRRTMRQAACPDYQPGDSSLSPDAARSIP